MTPLELAFEQGIYTSNQSVFSVSFCRKLIFCVLIVGRRDVTVNGCYSHMVRPLGHQDTLIRQTVNQYI